jgi:Ca-activated chloride channel family protein
VSFGFEHPWAFALLLLLPLWGWWAAKKRVRPAVTFARTGLLASIAPRSARVWSWLPAAMRAVAFVLLVVALSGPRSGRQIVESESEGIGIVVAMDVSSSMLAEDFRPVNRLGAAKRTLASFVRDRESDRIGLVTFAGEALTMVPLTTDHSMLLTVLESMQVGQLEDGTAIGLGLAAAANRLRRIDGSRVVILLSDGENNRGNVNPRDAARAAAAYGIRVFTIGVGSKTRARIPIARTPAGLRYGFLPVSIDEPLLRDIASLTGGRYFRATDARGLRRIYEVIDQLVRSPVRIRRTVEYRELYLPFLLAGAALFLLEVLFRATRWGRLP